MVDEVIRVTCLNIDCEHHGVVHEYNDTYRQHSIHLCGNCGGELSESLDGSFQRVKSNNPLHPNNHPQIKGLTKKERAAGWEVHPMIGKVAPDNG